MEIQRKQVNLVGLKLSDTGEFSALFAPFNSVDLQGDVTLPGAFGKQNVVISAYGHGSSLGSALPVGKGTIHDGETGGMVQGRFFLNTTQGRDTYNTVKGLGDLQEWSYSLPAVESELATGQELLDRGLPVELNGHDPAEVMRVLKRITVKEVSPVMMGAAVGSRTLEVKDGGTTLADHLEGFVAEATELADRVRAVKELRESEGRELSEGTRERIKRATAALGDLVVEIDDQVDRYNYLLAAELRFRELLSRQH